MTYSKINGALYGITHAEGAGVQVDKQMRHRDSYLSWNTTQEITSFVVLALGAYVGYKLMQMADNKLLTGALVVVGAPTANTLVGAIGRKLDPTESKMFDRLYPESTIKSLILGMFLGSAAFAAGWAVHAPMTAKKVGAIAYTMVIAYFFTIFALAGAMSANMPEPRGEKSGEAD